MIKTKKVGNLGENISRKFLENKGFLFVEKNFSGKIGEIDLVMKKKNEYFFVEVKTSSCDFNKLDKLKFLPEDHFDKRKIRKFSNIVELYVNSKNIKENYFLCACFVLVDLQKKKSKIRFLEEIS